MTPMPQSNTLIQDDIVVQPRPLRILQVITSVDPERGGPTTAMWNLLEALHRREMNVDLVTTGNELEMGSTAASMREVVHNGTTVRYFRRQTQFYHVSLPLLRWLMTNIRQYDVVHVHGLFTFAPLVAAWCAWAAKVPYIVRPHGTLNRWGRERRRPALKRASLALLEGPILRHAARVHFASHSELQQAAEVGIAMQAIVCPLGIDIAPAALPEQQQPAGSADTPDLTVLFLSRIVPIKNLDRLLEAFALVAREHSNATLVIAGDGPQELVRALHAQAERLALGAQVRWLGFVHKEHKAGILANATLLVLPSASENFGVAVVEAMAAGIPVVVSDGVGIADIVAESGAGVVFDGTVEQLATSIGRLLADADVCRSMGKAGRRLVAEKLSLEAMGRNLADLYASVATTDVRTGQMRSLSHATEP